MSFSAHNTFSEAAVNALTNHMKTTREKAVSNETAISDLGTDLVGLSENVTAAFENVVTVPGGGSMSLSETFGEGPYEIIYEPEDVTDTRVYTATIGTTWDEDSTTGVKSQFVPLLNQNGVSSVTAQHNARVDPSYTGDGSSESFATFVEQKNQFFNKITNGYARTIDGGIMFYIFGDANTVEISIVAEVF